MRLAQLTGSHADGTLQVAESAINELLVRIARGRRPVIEVLERNVLILRYGMLHTRATLPRSITPGESPLLTLHLASLLVAWGLKAVVHKPFLHIHGRRLTIELARVQALHPWRGLWRHLQQLTFATVPGALRLTFSIVVHDDAAALRPNEDATIVAPQEH
jgi:hypothetical protein